MKQYTLTNRDGESISPMTSTKTVFDANGTDLETLLSEQQQAIDDGLGACAKKTEVAQGLATKQDALSDSADITVSADNELLLTDKAKYATFIDAWNAEGSYCHKSHDSYPITAKYDPENAPDMAHPFVCNGLWLTYAEALDVYNHRLTRGTIRTGTLRGSHIRTALCAIHSVYAENFSLDFLFYGATKLEFVRLSTNDPQGIWVNDMTSTFANCRKLREIVPTIVDVVKANYFPAWMNTFNMCDSLVSVKIKGLTHSLVFRDSPLLSLDSISFMVSNAANTAAITITLHPDAYARVTEEIFAAAAEKNITIAST